MLQNGTNFLLLKCAGSELKCSETQVREQPKNEIQIRKLRRIKGCIFSCHFWFYTRFPILMSCFFSE